MCLGPGMFCWPVAPVLICSIAPPDAKNSLTCSSIELDVSVAAGCFFFAEDLVLAAGLIAVLVVM
mgnify:FL=1